MQNNLFFYVQCANSYNKITLSERKRSHFFAVCDNVLFQPIIKYTKMPKYVVTYFNVKALAEPTRLLLSYGGQEFEDRRIEREDWEKIKPNFPFRQLPVLEIDGKQFAQSMSIARYLGHKFGVAGANFEEDLEIDQAVDFFNDIRLKASAPMYEQDPEIKKKKTEENIKNNGWMLEKLNDIIVKNKGHLACGKLTWADFVFAGIYDALKFMMQSPDLDSKFPAFKQLQDAVYSLPGVKEFAEKAPKTDL
ncbi:glutathione S-transferase 2 [Phthorimaea operculella]|nr:glutathione S-transferase 2 [Phthorimaea operculella]